MLRFAVFRCATAATATAGAPRFTPPLTRSVKTLCGDLKKGFLIVHKNKLARVLDIHKSVVGRGTPQMELTCDEVKRAPGAQKFARHSRYCEH
jgi:hypothetical protein